MADKKKLLKMDLQVSELLKGIEGFDNDRAAECLGRLLDAHYDTIGVLKLATKQDLIEDAGLKPGDAVRIVSAAKIAVPVKCLGTFLTFEFLQEFETVASSLKPRRQTPSSPSHGLQNRAISRLVHPQSYVQRRLWVTPRGGFVTTSQRARTVAQETLKSEGQGVVNQAAPKDEIVKEANEPAASDIPVALQHACGVCNVTCTSESDMRSHFNGARHAYNMDFVNKDYDNLSHNITTYLHCSICNVTCVRKKNLVAHFNGRRHSYSLKRADS